MHYHKGNITNMHNDRNQAGQASHITMTTSLTLMSL